VTAGFFPPAAQRRNDAMGRNRTHAADATSFLSAFALHRFKSLLAVGSFSMTCLTAAAFQIDPPATDPTPLAR